MDKNGTATYPSITIKNIGGTIPASLSFVFQTRRYTFTIDVPKSIYFGARESQKYARIPPDWKPNQWRPGYCNGFIFDKVQRPVLSALISLFRKVRLERKLDDSEYLELIATFVQTIPYDSEKADNMKHDNSSSNGVRFPVETLVDNKGICSEKSLLLAALLEMEGYAVSLLGFESESHMAVGIPTTTAFEYSYTGLAFVESTSLSYVGERGKSYGIDEISLESKPWIVKIGTGKKRYMYFDEIRKILKLKDKIAAATKEGGVLKDELNRRDNMLSQKKKHLNALMKEVEAAEKAYKKLSPSSANYDMMYNRYSSAVDNYNELVHNHKMCVEEYNDFVGVFNRAIHLHEYLLKNTYNRKGVSAELKKYSDIITLLSRQRK